MMIYMGLCAYLSITRYITEKKLREKWDTYSVSLMVSEITEQIRCYLCIHFWISIFNNHCLLIISKTWISHIFRSFTHLFPFISIDNQEYTALILSSILTVKHISDNIQNTCKSKTWNPNFKLHTRC
jgi:hypothetical protein